MQGISIIETADVGFADKNLRHATGAGGFAHGLKRFGVVFLVDFNNFGNTDLF